MDRATSDELAVRRLVGETPDFMRDPSRLRLLGMRGGLSLATGLVWSAMLAAAAWLKVRNTQSILDKTTTVVVTPTFALK